MSSTPLVSIIIPCYNPGDRLKACLHSCLQQTYPHIEILLVDNNSTDDSMAIARQMAVEAVHPIRLLHCGQQGANVARNHGFNQAQGQYIQWLDADDELAPSKTALQVAALAADPESDIAYGDWSWRFCRQGQLLLQLSLRSLQWDDPLLSLLVDNWQPPHTYLLRRSTAQRLQEFEAWQGQTVVSMDRQYFTLAALLGFRFLHVPQAQVYYYHWSASQITQTVPYAQRVQSLKAMFQRFQQVVEAEGGDRLQPIHQTLLYQSWELWTMGEATLHRVASDRFQLLQHQTGKKQVLNDAEAMIVAALLKTNQPLTLEDHARLVVRRLWSAIEQRRKQVGGAFDPVKQVAIEQELDRLLGGAEVQQGRSLNQTVTAIHVGDHGSFNSWSQLVPLYCPLWGTQRLMVMQTLDRLQQKGWLVALENVH